MVASDDVESQKKGIIMIVWPGGPGADWAMGGEGKRDARARHLINQRHEVIPARFAGYHYCMPDSVTFRLIRSFLILYGGVNQGMRSRMRFHVGT